jgi:hypothetical protein
MPIVVVLWSLLGLFALVGSVLGLAAAFALGRSAYHK